MTKKAAKLEKEFSETNQTEDRTLDDQMKDGANSGVFQFTETDVNYLTVLMMMMMTKPNQCQAIKGSETPVSLPCPQGQPSSIRLISNL